MFDQTNDAELFHTAPELKADGFRPAGACWVKGRRKFLPLYEAKMVQAYDHRAASVVVDESNWMRQGQTEAASLVQHQNPEFSALPRFWVAEKDVDERLSDGELPYYLCYKDVTSATNQRTMIAAFIPKAGVVNSAPLILTGKGIKAAASCCLLANLNSLAYDYVARQKVGGLHLNFFIVEQLPVLPPSRYEETFGGVLLRDFVGERVLELTYTAHDIAAFAEDMGYVDEAGEVKPPFVWDEERRLHLKCQLDAMYLHLYGLTREEADYVLETFPIVKRRDMAQSGRFRTKELILQYYAAYAAGDFEAWVQA